MVVGWQWGGWLALVEGRSGVLRLRLQVPAPGLLPAREGLRDECPPAHHHVELVLLLLLQTLRSSSLRRPAVLGCALVGLEVDTVPLLLESGRPTCALGRPLEAPALEPLREVGRLLKEAREKAL